VNNPAATRAPGLAIYGTTSIDAGDVVVGSTTIQLTDGANIITVTYTGKTLKQVAQEISTNSQQYEAIALNEVAYLAADDLLLVADDTTPDGGLVVRLRGHVIRYREDLRIRLLPPHNDDPRRPWFARIDTGQVVKVHKGIRYLFRIPEYDDQPWSTLYGKPYVDQSGVQPLRIDARTLQVPRRPIFWHRGNVVVNVNGVRQSTNMVEDVDEHNGFIFLSRPVEQQDVVQVAYVYREQTYIYPDINLNPTTNHMPQFVGQFVLFYLKPAADSIGRTWLRTVLHSAAATLEGAISQIPNEDVPVMLLGALAVRQVNTIDEVKVIDTRSRGGGLYPDKYQHSVKVNRHMMAVTDRGNWDGVPYPGNAVVIVDLPASLKDALEVGEIRQRVQRHVAMGVEPVLDFREGE
jgi:hypothetical protein